MGGRQGIPPTRSSHSQQPEWRSRDAKQQRAHTCNRSPDRRPDGGAVTSTVIYAHGGDGSLIARLHQRQRRPRITGAPGYGSPARVAGGGHRSTGARRITGPADRGHGGRARASGHGRAAGACRAASGSCGRRSGRRHDRRPRHLAHPRAEVGGSVRGGRAAGKRQVSGGVSTASERRLPSHAGSDSRTAGLRPFFAVYVSNRTGPARPSAGSPQGWTTLVINAQRGRWTLTVFAECSRNT